ncbi:MAG: diguanylate cyclase domain-containing protein [Anaerovoracaceae bacterium]|jgi:diguanylate cyclase (GGDEF)-like protein
MQGIKDIKKLKDLSFWSIAVGLMVWLTIVLAASFLSFFGSIDRHISEQAVTTLRDVSKGISQLLETKIEGQWATLAPVTKFAEGEKDLLQSEPLLHILESMKTASRFSTVFIADNKGQSVNSDGLYVDIADRYYYKKAMQGYQNISSVLKSRVTGEDVFIFANPVRGDSGVRGILGAAIQVKDFEKLIDHSIFDGKGYVYIISGNGDIVVKSAPDQHPIKDTNIITFLAREETESSITARHLTQDMRTRQQGYFTFVGDGDMQNAYYEPLEVNDWYVICGVPLNCLKTQSSGLFWIAMRLCLGILIALAPVVLTFWRRERNRKEDLIKQNKELQWNEKRFRIVTSLSNSIIFEVDLEKRTILYPDGFKSRMGYEPVTEGFPYSLVEAGHVHPDDAEDFIAMHTKIPPNTEKLVGEFRIMGRRNEYVWHRIEEVLMLDEKGKAIKSIGRALNIDDEKKAIQLLEAKSQIDSGSGLYNKHATGVLIHQCLKENSQGKHAMVFLDIDDFKKINDSRGHVYGDQVIADLADIMRTQFRATDIMGRIGGDEFMLFFKDIPNELFVAAKIAKVRHTFVSMHEIGISAGIALYPQDGTSYMDLYKHADMAMYAVKKSGKNRYEFYADIREQELNGFVEDRV